MGGGGGGGGGSDLNPQAAFLLIAAPSFFGWGGMLRDAGGLFLEAGPVVGGRGLYAGGQRRIPPLFVQSTGIGVGAPTEGAARWPPHAPDAPEM